MLDEYVAFVLRGCRAAPSLFEKENSTRRLGHGTGTRGRASAGLSSHLVPGRSTCPRRACCRISSTVASRDPADEFPVVPAHRCGMPAFCAAGAPATTATGAAPGPAAAPEVDGTAAVGGGAIAGGGAVAGRA